MPAGANDIILLSDAKDYLGISQTDSLVTTRPAGGTVGLSFTYFRIIRGSQ